MNYHYYNDDELWLLNYINKIKFEQLYFIENKNQQKFQKNPIKNRRVFVLIYVYVRWFEKRVEMAE